MARRLSVVPIFFCEPTGTVARKLRRYRTGAEHKCASGEFYCDASTALDVVADTRQQSGEGLWPLDDPRWPTACQRCGAAFGPQDPFQLFHDELYRRIDTGAIAPWRDMPAGAVRNNPSLAGRPGYTGPDGRSLEVTLPDGRGWIIDSRAKNCGLPNDNAHKCWVRHGRPEDGTLHVDKNGVTCSAGAGSIATETYHGFLHNGALRAC